MSVQKDFKKVIFITFLSSFEPLTLMKRTLKVAVRKKHGVFR